MTRSQDSILIVLTNTHQLLGSHRTGFNVKEVAHLHECLCKSGHSNLIFASPKGGETFIDPFSLKSSEHDETVQKFIKDSEAMQMVKNTKRLDEINLENVCCAVFPGGPGTLFDLPNNHRVSEIVQQVWERNNGYIATIGHGIAALLNVKSPKGDHELWLRGKRVTCNTVEEEQEMQLDKALPFMLEQKLREIGVKFEKANKFQSNVVMEEKLITGQNCNSTKEWVQHVVKCVGKHN